MIKLLHRITLLANGGVSPQQAEEEKADTVVNGTSLYPFSLPLINQAERRPSFRTSAFLYDKGENYELVYVIRLSLTGAPLVLTLIIYHAQMVMSTFFSRFFIKIV